MFHFTNISISEYIFMPTGMYQKKIMTHFNLNFTPFTFQELQKINNNN